MSDLIFENQNGSRYVIVVGNNDWALLREMRIGCYVLARGLDWNNGCWGGGSYFAVDEFKDAVNEYLKGVGR